MTNPHFLTPGDTIGICAPAGKVNSHQVKEAIKLYESWGLKVITTPSLFNNHFRYAGTHEERKNDFQELINHPDIKAIFCARGGYGCNKILDQLDFTAFNTHPKWVLGFSDITQIHARLNQLKIESIHAPMPNSILNGSDKSIENTRKLLFGELPSYTFEAHEYNRTGKATGDLVGGNLALIVSLLGTPLELDAKDKILFIEDIDEYWYHHDRMINQLKRAGKLSKLKGLIVGQFSDMKDSQDSFGTDPLTSIREHVAEYNFPVVYNFPAGHVKDNNPLVLGRKINLEVNLEYSKVFY